MDPDPQDKIPSTTLSMQMGIPLTLPALRAGSQALTKRCHLQTHSSLFICGWAFVVVFKNSLRWPIISVCMRVRTMNIRQYACSITRSRKGTKMGICCCYHKLVEASWRNISSSPLERQGRKDEIRNHIFSVKSIY